MRQYLGQKCKAFSRVYRGRSVQLSFSRPNLLLFNAKMKNFDPLVKDKLEYYDQQEIFMNKLQTELEIAQNELKSL